MPLFSCSWIIDPAQERAVVSEKNWSLVFMKRKNKIGRGSVTTDKFIDWRGERIFCGICQILPFFFWGEKQGFDFWQQPKEQDKRIPVPFSSRDDPSLRSNLSRPLPNEAFLCGFCPGHSQPEFHILLLLTSISLLYLHFSFQGTLGAGNSSPGIPFLLPSAVLGEVGRFLHVESHTMLRKNKILKLFLLWSLENKNAVSYLKVVLCLILCTSTGCFTLLKMNSVNGTGGLLC